MKIIELKASNVKRLTAVQIKPDTPLVHISGKNDQGKSSVLDSIWYALGGAEAIDTDPIHAGADRAEIFLDLGEYKVTRKITRKEGSPPFTTTLVVENAEGMRPKSPQALLNDLVGQFSLDPLAFSRMKPREQFDAMKSLVPGFDFDASAKADAEDYERRTAVNRKAREAKAAAAAIGAPEHPVKPVDEEAILADIARAGEHNAAIEERRGRRAEAQRVMEARKDAARQARSKIEELEMEIVKLRATALDEERLASELAQKLADALPLPEPLDTLKLSEALSAARAVNAAAQKQTQRDDLLRAAQDLEDSSKAITDGMEARAAARSSAIAAAKLPVPGLSLGTEEVLIDGFPFAQAATSKKIRTSVALAMALNPKIRVIRIMDGSLLDSDAMAAVEAMAKENDFQIWVESVNDGAGAGIIIENGHIKEDDHA